VPEEEDVARRNQARPSVEALRTALSRRGLSIVALLADLDHGLHGKVLFDAFQVTASRHQLGLEAADFTQIASAVGVDSRGLFTSEDLLRLLSGAEEASVSRSTSKSSPGKAKRDFIAAGSGEALEGLPPLTHSSASSGQRRGRSTGAVSAASKRPIEGAVEVKSRRQLEMVQSQLLQSEDERQKLQKEITSLRQEANVQAEDLNKPRPLSVLLSLGDNAPSIVKDLKLEVKGTRELRDKLFLMESELETCKRRLEVDARQDLEKERHTVASLRAQLEEKERALAETVFDLHRARRAAGESDWDQREEEFMRLNLQIRKLEEELTAKARAEQEAADRLLEQEHQVMELRFEREQVQGRTARLESRVLELELAAEDVPQGRKPSGPPGSAAAAVLTVSGRKEQNLKNVIESLERVVSQQKVESQRLRMELEGRRPDDKKHKAEIERMRKKVGELEAELSSTNSQGRSRRSRPPPAAEDLEEKDRRIADLEERLRRLGSEVDRPQAAAEEEVQRLQEELRNLQHARSVDALTLDEAERALQEAELADQRYHQVELENRQLRQDIAALHDEGFWEEIRQLQRHYQEAVTLARESRSALERLAAAEAPADLMARLDRFAAAPEGSDPT